ncbi:hypothetical protein RN001_002380 [Aquatica leii]|uniref:Regulatory protein zeste n=1 Tax=Aquatica leii TaxID=1421715 RepID=A0AAN7SLT3_9COLE|nr:hypothetical protein RN001_002380 [Aquatica leii]
MTLLDKKKRLAKTSTFQYETYLSFMEECDIFRTGIINPTVPSDYILKKWEQLTVKLNNCDTGPILSVTEWQKRFSNWKNSTRMKYRSKVEDLKCTGGGPESNIQLSVLEERGLSVWGRVAVTGTTKVKLVGGLQLPTEEELRSNLEPNDLLLNLDISEDLKANLMEPIITEPSSSSSLTKEDDVLPQCTAPNKIKTRKVHSTRSNINSKTVKGVGLELLSSYTNNSTARAKEHQAQMEFEAKKLRLEKIKLKFEISKYKFENPEFQFDETELNDW